MQAEAGTAIGATRRRVLLSARGAWALGLSIALVGYALDQVTKALAIAFLDPADPPVLLGGLLTLQLIRNPGAAFSLGEDFTLGLTGIAVVAFVFVVVRLLPRARHRGWVIGLGLLLAGILGNLTDRFAQPPGPGHGHVVDFLQLPRFAIFNVADMCITFAAVTIIWLVLVAQVDLDGASTRQAPEPSAGVSA